MKTDKELAEEIKGLLSGDPEMDHGRCDDFVVTVLRDAGYPLLAETYDNMCNDFWYA